MSEEKPIIDLRTKKPVENPIPSPPPSENRLLRVEEVAERLGISRRAVYELLRCKELHSVKMGHYLVPAIEVDAYLRRQKEENKQ